MATGFDIDEEDYNWWVDICEDADLDPTQRFTKRVLAVIKRTTTIRTITTIG